MTDHHVEFSAAILDLVCGLTTATQFETWLYGFEGLHDAVGQERALELLELDYRAPGAAKALGCALQTWPGFPDEHQRARHIARAMLGKRLNLVVGCDLLAAMDDQDTRSTFAAFASDVADVPRGAVCAHWSAEASPAAVAKLSHHEPDILEAARGLLERLAATSERR